MTNYIPWGGLPIPAVTLMEHNEWLHCTLLSYWDHSNLQCTNLLEQYHVSKGIHTCIWFRQRRFWALHYDYSTGTGTCMMPQLVELWPCTEGNRFCGDWHSRFHGCLSCPCEHGSPTVLYTVHCTAVQYCMNTVLYSIISYLYASDSLLIKFIPQCYWNYDVWFITAFLSTFMISTLKTVPCSIEHINGIFEYHSHQYDHLFENAGSIQSFNK